MKTLALITSAIILSGCSLLIPVEQKFPEAPEALVTEKCPNLELLPTGTTDITEMLKTVVRNYHSYYNCSNKVDGWQEWYIEQKKIFDSVYD